MDTQSLIGSLVLPWTYIPTETEHEEGEGKEENKEKGMMKDGKEREGEHTCTGH